MTNPETYTALLQDAPDGPVVERLEHRELIDRRPERVIRRHHTHDNQPWVKVYELEPFAPTGHTHTYLLAYEGPEPT